MCAYIIKENRDQSGSELQSLLAIEIVRDETYHRRGVCARSGNAIETAILLNSLNLSNPQGHCGPLINPCEIVIQDIIIDIELSFPLTTEAVFRVHAANPLGFSRLDLLFLVKQLYKYIYEREDETSTPREFEFTSECKCSTQNIVDFLPETNQYTGVSNQICSICRDNLDGTIALQLHCSHFYHKECITEWIVRGQGRVCPMCRTSLANCSECDGSGTILETIQAPVIPLEYRDLYTPRVTTDGDFGIRFFYEDQLAVKEFVYNRIQKRLAVLIKPDSYLV